MNFKVTWKRIQPEPDPIYGSPLGRSSHGISVIHNTLSNTYRIYIVGGEHDPRVPIEDYQSVWCAEQQQPDSSDSWKWRCCSFPSTVVRARPPLRIAHAQCCIGNKIYIFGGRCGQSMGESSFHDLWVLDCSIPGQEVWEEISYSSAINPPPEPRSYHQMVAVKTEEPSREFLFVFGGCGANGRIADLHQFDLSHRQWVNCDKCCQTHTPTCCSSLAGRGGSNLLVLSNPEKTRRKKLAVLSGFIGHETDDGQVFDIDSHCWEATTQEEEEKQSSKLNFQGRMRPRSVCSYASGLCVKKMDQNVVPIAVIFGGEVDPSEMGHSGAGSFENDMIVLHGSTGDLLQVIAPTPTDDDHHHEPWPCPRGWAFGATAGEGDSNFFLFGGLTGDDDHPERLDDLWMCTFHS